jgi:hypothetical protein
MSDRRQKNRLAHSESVVRNQQMVLAFDDEYRSEAPNGLAGGTESLRRSAGQKAWSLANAVQQLPEFLKQHWPVIREQRLSGTYMPQPVKRVEIPKPD